jgi:AcrR family transcriptional regulator
VTLGSDGAFALLARRGVNAVGMREIAQALGVSTGTLYHYFSTKEALFEQMFLRQCRRDLAPPPGSEGAPLEARIDALIRFVLSEHEHFTQQALVTFDVLRKPSDAGAHRSLKRLATAYRDKIARNLGISPALAELVSSAIDGLVLHHLADPDSVNLEEQLRLLGEPIRARRGRRMAESFRECASPLVRVRLAHRSRATEARRDPKRAGTESVGRAVIEHMLHECSGMTATYREGRRCMIPAFRHAAEIRFPAPLGTARVYDLGHAELATFLKSFGGVSEVRTLGGLHPPFLNGVFQGIAAAVVAGSLGWNEAVDAVLALDEGRADPLSRATRAALRGVAAQCLRGEIGPREVRGQGIAAPETAVAAEPFLVRARYRFSGLRLALEPVSPGAAWGSASNGAHRAPRRRSPAAG